MLFIFNIYEHLLSESLSTFCNHELRELQFERLMKFKNRSIKTGLFAPTVKDIQSCDLESTL